MLSYLFTSALLLFTFSFGYYLFLLAKPALNLRRRVLLLGIAGVLLVPLCPAPTWPDGPFSEYSAADRIAVWEALPVLVPLDNESTLSQLIVEPSEAAHNTTDTRVYLDAAWLLYLAYFMGVVLMLSRTLIGLGRLLRIHRSSRSVGDGLRLLAGDGEAFTFGRTVYLSESVFSSADADVIIEHERAHAAQLHTVDALLAEVLRAFFWFHPLAWWVREQVQLNLEYLADASVLRAGYEKRAYQLSLVAHQQGTDFRTSLLPQFAARGLKRRIKMMTFRAGPRVRSELMSGVMVFCLFAVFTVTNGKAQHLARQITKIGAPVPLNTDFSSLYDGQAKEYNIYFRRLPTVEELEALRQPLEDFYGKDLFMFRDCTDPAGVFTFAYGSATENLKGEVKARPGDLFPGHRRFQFNKNGRGAQGAAVFNPLPLPEGAPDEDIVLDWNGIFVTVTSDEATQFHEGIDSYVPLKVQMKCLLNLTPETVGKYNVSQHFQSGYAPDNSGYALGRINGTIHGMMGGELDDLVPTDFPIRYFIGDEETQEEDFARRVVGKTWTMHVALRFNGARDMAVVRVDEE